MRFYLALAFLFLSIPSQAETLYFPQVVDGAGYQTKITIFNTGRTTVTGTLKFFAPNGTPWIVTVNSKADSQFLVSLPSKGSVRFTTLGTDPRIATGWAQLESSSELMGVAAYDVSSDGILLQTVGILGSSDLTRFAVPVDYDRHSDLGLALINTSNSSPLSVTLKLLDESGQIIQTSTDADYQGIPPNGYVAKLVSQAFPSIPSTHKGTLIGEANEHGSMAVTGLVLKDGLMSAIPVADTSPAPQAIFVGSSNGVYKSTDDATSWVDSFSGLSGVRVTLLSYDKTSPGTIYAGTQGSGLFKTTNGGNSWNAINTGLSDPNIYSLAINPKSTQIIYAGTSLGVFRTTNGGRNWVPVSVGIVGTAVGCMAIDPTTPQTLYASVANLHFNGGTLYKSTNGGDNWFELDLQPWVYNLTISPTSSRTIYAGTGGSGVYKSTDGGQNWAAIAGLDESYVYSLAFDPSEPKNIYAGTFFEGMFKSTDGGNSWTAINNGLLNYNVFLVLIDPKTPQIIYAETRGGGVYKSLDGGANWSLVSEDIPGEITALVITPSY